MEPTTIHSGICCKLLYCLQSSRYGDFRAVLFLKRIYVGGLLLPYLFDNNIVVYPSEIQELCKSALCSLGTKCIFPFQNNKKNVYPSFNMDLDFWESFGRKTPSYNKHSISLYITFCEHILNL